MTPGKKTSEIKTESSSMHLWEKMYKTSSRHTLFDTIHETLAGSFSLADVSLLTMVDVSRNLEEVSHSRNSQEGNLNQRERIGRQPIAQHRLQTVGQPTNHNAQYSQRDTNKKHKHFIITMNLHCCHCA